MDRPLAPKERRKKSSGCIIPRRGRICKHLFCKLHFFREENFGIGWNCNFKGKRLVTSAPAGRGGNPSGGQGRHLPFTREASRNEGREKRRCAGGSEGEESLRRQKPPPPFHKGGKGVQKKGGKHERLRAERRGGQQKAPLPTCRGKGRLGGRSGLFDTRSSDIA